MDDLYQRAVAAYFRSEDIPMQPAEALSGPESHNGKDYVVLRNNGDTLAVYRVRNNGLLKRLRRWPKTFDEEW